MHELLELVRFLLVLLGVVYLVTASTIAGIFRILVSKGSYTRTQLFYCPACFGFWVGAVLGLLGYWPFTRTLPLAAFEAGMAAMVAGSLFSNVVRSPFAAEVFALELPQMDAQEVDRDAEAESENGEG
jgi:hypothetical protein